jgi:hypothetical protein
MKGLEDIIVHEPSLAGLGLTLVPLTVLNYLQKLRSEVTDIHEIT